MRRILAVVIAASLASALPARAQLPTTCANPDRIRLQSDELQRVRTAQLFDSTAMSSLMFMRDGSCYRTSEGTRSVSLHEFDARVVNRSGYAGGGNDGLLWQGRGVSGIASVSFLATSKHVSVAIAPEAAYAENRAFDVRHQGRAIYSPFADTLYLGRLDRPVRFGDKSFTRTSLGQSYLEANFAGISAGISNQNLWVGPGLRSSLLMSNTAPSFPHVFVGTTRPVNIYVGALSAVMVGGQLTESQYYDTVSVNNHDDFSLLHVEFEPAPVRGLFLGFSRVFTQNSKYKSLDLKSVVDPLFQPFWKINLATAENPTGSSPDNQLLSFSARWLMPASNFELYGEWGREDHSANFKDFIQEPDHSQATLVGFQKGLQLKNSTQLVFGGEITTLQRFTPPRTERSSPSWYTHLPHGYTNRGELLGSWIGPGSDSQLLHADLLRPNSTTTFYAERVRRNEAKLYQLLVGQSFMYRHDVELTGGFTHTRMLRPGLSAVGGAAYSSRMNRDFLHDDHNVSAQIGLSFRPGAAYTF